MSEQQVNASQEKLSEIRPMAKLQGTEEVMLRNPLLFSSFLLPARKKKVGAAAQAGRESVKIKEASH